jgi:diguanylate cyclase (GGDEF)-like protein
MTTSTVETLSTLAEAIDEVAAADSLEEVQRRVHAAARRLTGADGAELVMRDGRNCHCVEEDPIVPLLKGRSFALEDCVSGWSMIHHEPVVIEDIYADERVPHDLYRATAVKSLLVVPIRSNDPLGAIGLYWSEPHRASHEEVAVVRALAGSSAGALERARLTNEVERRRVTEEDLRELSERDPLTGVLNRRAWDQALAGAVRKGNGNGPLYVVFLDLDHFKGYNDLHGHPAGDDLLRRAATAWRSVVRAVDVLARYGGEEFAVLLAGCQEDVALDIAERLRLATIDEQRVSIGVARWDGVESPASLIDRADHALYGAKRAGRNRVMISS